MAKLHRRTLLRLGGAMALLGARAARAKTPARPIDERGFVRIGGIDQWIAIQGQNAANPVILYLHGGPAEAQSPFLDQFLPWEADFTVVNWDQRGAGKTYGRNGPSTPDVTLNRMVDDAIEVAEHVRRRLGASKVVLVGQSWGAILGLNAVKRRPELFHAFVGTGQPVSWALTVADQERWARLNATAAGDQAALKTLDETASLPLNDMRRIMATARWKMSPSDLEYLSKVQGGFLGAPPFPKTGDVADWAAGGAFSVPKLTPEIFNLDIRRLGLSFAVPIIVIQGRDDHVVSFEPARVWLAEVKAPTKAFIPIDGGHFACFTDPQQFVAALRRTVLPLT